MTRTPRLPHSVEEEGADAFAQDLPRRDCPYPPGADEREAWLAGWDRAAARAGGAPRVPD
ncbi:MAG: hypothetical protein KGL12_16765 [Rhodospirillales bacterium]|nr:hypothetical protein [Rhodospirillales bacterium]